MKRRLFLKSFSFAALYLKANASGLDLFIKDKTNRITKIDISDESTEGGEIECFIEAGLLRKFNIQQYGETYQYKATYLLSNNESLLRVAERLTQYNTHFSYDEGTARLDGNTEWFDINKSLIDKSTFYFNNCKIVNSFPTKDNTNKVLAEKEKEHNDRLVFVLDRINRKSNLC